MRARGGSYKPGTMSTTPKTRGDKESRGEATPADSMPAEQPGGRYLNELLTSLHSLSEEREARWRKEQCEREMQLKLEAEERERKRHDEAELKALEVQQVAELKQQQLKFESEEKERKRDAQFDALINQLAQANNDSLAFAKWAKQDEEATARQQEEENYLRSYPCPTTHDYRPRCS